MELEDDLRKLRFNEAPAALRARILRDARDARQASLLPPWFIALERHWLYPGRRPAAATLVAWLIIASLRFGTPASLAADSHAISTLNEDQLVQFERDNARLLAELESSNFTPATLPQPASLHRESLPPRS